MLRRTPRASARPARPRRRRTRRRHRPRSSCRRCRARWPTWWSSFPHDGTPIAGAAFGPSEDRERLDMLLRRVARTLLAAMFIQGGINALKAPELHAKGAKPVLDAVAPAVDKAVEVAPIERRPDDVVLVKIAAVVKIVAGSLLAMGKFPRLSSAALAASLIPTTFAGHRFWEESDPQRKREQQIHFVKNAGLLGGLLIAAADTEGKPSLGWRGRGGAKLATVATTAPAGTLS